MTTKNHYRFGLFWQSSAKNICVCNSKAIIQAALRTNVLFKISNYIQNLCKAGKELKENYLTLHSIFYCINEWSVEFTKVAH